jgi:nucleoside-diphosphate-sugar epimerase
MSSNTIPKKVFITGAGGFLGTALMDYYRALGVEVVGMDIVADAASNIVAGDLLQPAGWKAALEDCDVVIHTAAFVSNTASYQQVWDVNVLGTRKVIECAVAAGASRFVQISSVAAFGFDYADGVTETEPLMPVGHPYIDTKIASEHVALAAHGAGECDVTIVRPGDVYGPRSRPWVILPLEMIRRGRMILPAHGEGIFTPVYIDDITDGIALAASKPEGRGQIFSMDGGEQVSCKTYFSYLCRFVGNSEGPKCVSTATANLLSEVVGRFERLTGKPSELGKNTMGMLSRKGGYSIEKARNLLGYQPATNLDQGMETVKTWLQAEKMI